MQFDQSCLLKKIVIIIITITKILIINNNNNIYERFYCAKSIKIDKFNLNDFFCCTISAKVKKERNMQQTHQYLFIF